MLIVMFHRVTTVPDDEPGSEYNVYVQVNDRRIALGRVHGHRRSDGWRKLVQKFLNEGAGKDLD